MKFIKMVLALTIFFSIASTAPVLASNFLDVPVNHFAVEAIRWVSSPANGSYMVGDASNNFNPSRVPDSFETAIALAMAAGFKYSPASITPADQAMFDLAYERHGAALESMASIHPSWRRIANREIAFLMELDIITQNDLMNFISVAPNGTETVALLSKEAAATFVLRLANQTNFPETQSFTFTDNAAISAMYRQYAYLAYQLGIVTTYDGHFSPARHVTRAELAQMFYTLRISAPSSPGFANANPPTPLSTPTPTPTPEPESPFTRTFHGTLDSVLPNAIQITTENGTSTYEFAANPVIMLNNERINPTDLEVGMLAAVGLNANEQIISMLAREPFDAPNNVPQNNENAENNENDENIENNENNEEITPVPTPMPTPPPLPDVSELPPVDFPVATPIPTFPDLPTTAIPPIAVIPPNNAVLFRAEGVILGTTTTAAGPTITIRTSRVRILTGEVVSEDNTYLVTQHTTIMRGNENVPLSDLRLNEIITFDYSAPNILHALRLPERTRTIQGMLIARYFVEQRPVLVIEDFNGNTHELPVATETTVGGATTFVRNGSTAARWFDLRIGDSIVAQVEFDRLASITAQGLNSETTGFLEEIHITQQLDTITIRQANGTLARLALPPEVYDIYSLRLGMELHVSMESREIYNLDVLDPTAQIVTEVGFIGTIQSLRHGHTMVVTIPATGTTPASRRTIRVDGNTINTATDSTLIFTDLRTQMRLYIVMLADTNTAQFITILP
ncbi:MAG: S-layer homology domain-containing protein [Firmicutes bacterium]|nr:S-layer homology domain-containing protein [Bacillota bacterium]